MSPSRSLPLRRLLLLAGVLLVAGCGGGGGGGAPTPNIQPTDPSALRIEPYDLSATTVRMATLRSMATAQPVAGTLRLQLPAPSPEDLAEAAEQSLGGLSTKSRRIGMGRAVPGGAHAQALMQQLAWQPTLAGGHLASLQLRSEGAAALRVAFAAEALPADARVRVFPSRGGEVAELSGAELLSGMQGPRGGEREPYWLPTVSGDDVTLQVELAPGADPAALAFAVPMVSHLWVDLKSRSASVQLKAGTAGLCNVEGCQPGWTDEARAVTQMTFISPGGASALCTGTLMADTDRSRTPYVLTASHCIETPAAVNSLETYWFQAAAPCDANMPAPTRTAGVGAQLMYRSSDTDTALVRLVGTLPAGVRFAGSLLSAPAANIAAASLHHPYGHQLKFSEGAVRAFFDCTGTPGRFGTTVSCGAGSRFMQVFWSRGVTEGGSSGGALMTPVGSQKYVMGQLYAGAAACLSPDSAESNGQPDYYGRFDIAYRAALYQWLGDVPGAR